MFITPSDFQQQIADITLNLPIDKNIGLIIPFDFDCTVFNLILFVDKIEPLTHK
jgi:hypothetical protein